MYNISVFAFVDSTFSVLFQMSFHGEGGKSGVQEGGHMYTHGWFMSMYGENCHNIVKWLASIKINKLLFKKRSLSKL